MTEKPPATSTMAMPMPAIALHAWAGPAPKSSMPCPTAMRSAAAFRVFAPSSATMRIPITTRGLRENFRRASLPRLSPVASAVRSQISWTAIIIGKVTGAAQSMPLENAAPTWA